MDVKLLGALANSALASLLRASASLINSLFLAYPTVVYEAEAHYWIEKEGQQLDEGTLPSRGGSNLITSSTATARTLQALSHYESNLTRSARQQSDKNQLPGKACRLHREGLCSKKLPL